MYDTLIIGAGPAGLTAAIYCARYKMKCAVISSKLGGMVLEAHLIENYLGFTSISGLELSKKFKEHVKRFGVEIIEEEVVDIRKEGLRKNKMFVVTDKNSKKYLTKSLILAMGMDKKKLNVLGEEKYIGKGVSYCYTCDAPLFKDKVVGVVGGSNSAAMAALLLAEYAKKVYIIYRKERIRAEPVYVEAIHRNPKITIVNNSNIVKINGNKFVDSVDLDTGENIKLSGLFIEIGTAPLVALVKRIGVKLKHGYIDVDKEQKTNVSGVFAAGDITNATELKQIITASSQGAIAAASAYKYIKKE